MNDIPAWISAVTAVIGTIVAVFALVLSWRATNKVEKVTLDYAVVSSDGTVLRHSGFEDYGLSVSVADENVETSAAEMDPVYKISFSKTPEYFEISTMDGAAAQLKQIAPKEYKLIFVGLGYGSPIVRANFKVQAY